jgi:hypothetical protein
MRRGLLIAGFVLALVSSEWRAVHKTAVTVCRMAGFILIGTGLYVLALGVVPATWGVGMLPKVSMVVGAILLVGGAIWHFASTGRQFYTSLTHWNNHLYMNINHRQATSVTHGAARNVGGES